MQTIHGALAPPVRRGNANKIGPSLSPAVRSPLVRSLHKPGGVSAILKEMRRLLLLLPLAAVIACGPEPEEIGYLRRPLTAFCSVDVIGKGTKDVETDYLPHVITCENGAADTEALKAQAVAARTYLYYKLQSSGTNSICDGQSCQVYTCSAQPQQKHYEAVKATSGQVLVYSSVVICAFYVAGAKPSTASCVPLSSDSDPTNTEKYVTYNEGKTGSDVTQSTLGWVSPSNKYNRGCKSQNGANCLSKAGKKYPEILHFYYGADAKLTTATGSCVNPPPPPPPDQGVPPPPPPDQGVTPAQDQGVTPSQDRGVLPRDSGPPPPSSDGLPALADQGTLSVHTLQGGCSVGNRRPVETGLPLVLLAAFLLGRRRRR